MDIPPTIPTSFVPRSTFASTRRTFTTNFTDVFSIFAYAVLGVVFALALGVFFYGRILAGAQASKDAELAKAEKAIDLATVQGFMQLRDRLTAGQKMLGSHLALSNFFKLVETLLPTNVRVSNLHLTLDTTKRVRLEGAGVAKSFNALAAVSNSFAADGRIKEAIFSNIVVNRDSSVSFALSATLDPKVVAFSP